MGEEYNKLKIMIVDDNREARTFLQLILTSKFNCNAVLAENGQVALEIILSGNLPDLILLDLMMPIMNGYDFLKLIRGSPRTKNIPIIVCSALGEKETVRGILEEGITDYLLKPLNLPLVYGKVEKYLKKKITKFMEFTLDKDGNGYFYSDPFPLAFLIRVISIDGAMERDSFILQVGDSEGKTSKVEDNPIVNIPEHDDRLKLFFKFNQTKNRKITVFFEIMN